jgi:hypothetical protein
MLLALLGHIGDVHGGPVLLAALADHIDHLGSL